MEHILITEPKYYSRKSLGLYKKLGQVCTWDQLKKNKFLAGKITVAIVKIEYDFNKRMIDRFPNLRIIGTNTTGLNHIDLKDAEKKGIIVASLRDSSVFLSGVHATAELTWGLLLSLIRNISRSFEALKKGKWQRDENVGWELNNKTLGILGYGRLGKQVASYGKAFGMKVIASDPRVKKSVMKKAGVAPVTMDDLFKKSDIICCHVLLTDTTKNLIKAKHFRLMKKSAFFINTARGELLDESALLKGLKNGWLAGAATDVIRNEYGAKKNLLKNQMVRYARSHNNLLLVPHLGGATYESWETTELFIAQKIKKLLKG